MNGTVSATEWPTEWLTDCTPEPSDWAAEPRVWPVRLIHRRLLQNTDGRPPVSSALISRPPRMPAFFRKWINWAFLSSLLVASQKR